MTTENDEDTTLFSLEKLTESFLSKRRKERKRNRGKLPRSKRAPETESGPGKAAPKPGQDPLIPDKSSGEKDTSEQRKTPICYLSKLAPNIQLWRASSESKIRDPAGLAAGDGRGGPGIRLSGHRPVFLEIPKVEDFLAGGGSVWPRLIRLIRAIGLGEAARADERVFKAVKKVVKREGLYPILTGRQAGYASWRLEVEYNPF